jgi:MarR family transcriptional regulator for hemolysin
MASSIEQIRKSFVPLAAHMGRQWRRVIDHQLEPLGLTEATWLALVHLARAPEPLRQKDLAASMTLDSSSVVRLLDALESAGYIERMEGTDRRAKTIHLTARGNAIVAQVDKVASEARKRLLGGVSDKDMETAFRVLNQISASLSSALEQPS